MVGTDTEWEDRAWRLRMRQYDHRARLPRYACALLLASCLAGWLVYVPERLPEPSTPICLAPMPTPAPPEALAALLEMDADILAGIAKGEDADAAVAIQWVVLNRAGCQFLRDAPGPSYSCVRPLLAVAIDNRAFGTMKRGRFIPSWWPGREWWHPADRLQLAEIEGTANAVLLGYVPDPTGGATHFHRLGTWTPPWAPTRRKWRIFGVHAFYQERARCFPAWGLKCRS